MSPYVCHSLYYIPKPQGTNVLNQNILPYCHILYSYITYFDFKLIRQRSQTTRLHVSCYHHCHYCNVDFVLFHNVTCYTNSLLSCIQVHTTNLFSIMCTLVATCMILGRLECNAKCHLRTL